MRQKTYVECGAELERLKRELVTNPPKTLRALDARLRRANHLYDMAITDLGRLRVACRRFDLQLQRLVAKVVTKLHSAKRPASAQASGKAARRSRGSASRTAPRGRA